MDSNTELYHYGVLGMKWGVRRASKQYSSATTKEARAKAKSTLQKHREKGTAKIDKLEKRHTKLQAKRDKQIIKAEPRAAKYRSLATAYKRHSRATFSQRRSEKDLSRALDYDLKADAIMANVNKTKAKIAKNEKMQELYRREINNIDKAMINKGKKALKKAG